MPLNYSLYSSEDSVTPLLHELQSWVQTVTATSIIGDTQYLNPAWIPFDDVMIMEFKVDADFSTMKSDILLFGENNQLSLQFCYYFVTGTRIFLCAFFAPNEYEAVDLMSGEILVRNEVEYLDAYNVSNMSNILNMWDAVIVSPSLSGNSVGSILASAVTVSDNTFTDITTTGISTGTVTVTFVQDFCTEISGDVEADSDAEVGESTYNPLLSYFSSPHLFLRSRTHIINLLAYMYGHSCPDLKLLSKNIGDINSISVLVEHLLPGTDMNDVKFYPGSESVLLEGLKTGRSVLSETLYSSGFHTDFLLQKKGTLSIRVKYVTLCLKYLMACNLVYPIGDMKSPSGFLVLNSGSNIDVLNLENNNEYSAEKLPSITSLIIQFDTYLSALYHRQSVNQIRDLQLQIHKTTELLDTYLLEKKTHVIELNNNYTWS